MTSGRRKYLIIGLGVLAAIILAVLGAGTYFVNSAKPRLEMLASASLGMQVNCRRLHVSLLPPSISARDVKVSNNGSEVALIPTLQARAALPALFKGQLSISTIILQKPEFTFSRLENGTWNFETPKQDKKVPPGQDPFFLSTLDIRGGHLVWRDGANPLEMQDISLTARDLILDADTGQPFFARLSLAGDFSCRELRYVENAVIRNIAAHLQGRAGNFVFSPLTFQAFAGTASGKVTMAMADKSYLVGALLELSRFQAEDFFAAMTEDNLLRGEMDMVLDVTARGVGRHELLRSLQGKASMTGQDLTSIRFDLDNLMEQFIQGQQFDLVDLGAFMIIGPLGPAVTKAFDMTMTANAVQGGSTDVLKLVSLWDIDAGKALARDVALSTKKNRIAISGGIDIVARRFQNLVVAVIDARGCALVQQEMDGPFEHPEVKEPSFLETAAGPLISIFKGTVNFLTGEKCEVFYNGSVAAPKK